MHNLELLRKMTHSPIYNYAIPGLTSWLIGEPNADGCVRLFECSRKHTEHIIPHSHRFDFQCLVLRGKVINITWEESKSEDDADQFVVSTLVYEGKPGAYKKIAQPEPRWFKSNARTYREGEWYGMKHNEIHSILFDRDTSVLFFEGPQQSNGTDILEPYVSGSLIPTFKVEPWMFRRSLA